MSSTTTHFVDCGWLNEDKHKVMMALIGEENPKFGHVKNTRGDKDIVGCSKLSYKIKHTEEQEDKIIAKRLKKNKKKQAKKNKKKNKKTKTKTKKKTSQEHIDELNAEIYRKLKIYKQQKLCLEFLTAMDEHMKEICRKVE
jgi:hypothetical protein